MQRGGLLSGRVLALLSGRVLALLSGRVLALLSGRVLALLSAFANPLLACRPVCSDAPPCHHPPSSRACAPPHAERERE